MTIDERLEVLRQSTESLHDSVQEQSRQIQEHSQQIKRLDARERKTRAALGAAISAYLESLVDDGAGE